MTVAFSADGRRAAPADTQGPFDRTLKVSLRRDRDVLVRATMTLADGRARTLEQPIHCTAPLPRGYR